MSTIQRLRIPEAQNNTVWPDGLEEHPVRVSFGFGCTVCQNSDPQLVDGKRIYISYNMGGAIEAKTENLCAKTPEFSATHDVNVDTEVLRHMFNKRCEFTVWEVSKSTRDPLQGHAAGRIESDPEAAKPIAMNVAQTGSERRNTRLYEAIDSKGDWFKKSAGKASNGDHRGSNISPNIINFELRRANSEKLIVAAPVIDHWPEILSVFPKEKSHPHHYNHPEKHIDLKGASARSIQSRSTSSLSDYAISRSRTPPSPHHYDAVLNTVLSNGKNKVIVIPEKRELKQANLEMKGIKQKLSESFNNLKVSPETQISVKPAISRPVTAKSDMRIRWDVDHVGVRNTHCNDTSEVLVSRKANDQTIQLETLPPIHPKRKGDYTHTALGKISLDLSSLFAGETVYRSSSNKISDFVISIEIRLDTALLSDIQRKILNPMIVNLKSVTNLPQDHCPIFKFRFCGGMYMYSSKPDDVQKRSKKNELEINTKHVLLAGIFHCGELHDKLLDGFEIEIHDSSTKKMKAGKLGTNGILDLDSYSCNPHGVARFDMASLLNGCSDYKASVQVLPGGKGKNGRQAVDWMYRCVTMSIGIELARPLFSINTESSNLLDNSLSMDPCFAKIGISVPSVNNEVCIAIINLMDNINRAALNIPGDQVLSSLELSEAQKHSTAIVMLQLIQDVVTGYHIYDSLTRVFLFEGLKCASIEKLCSLANRLGVQYFEIGHNSCIRKRELVNLDLMNLRLEPMLTQIHASANLTFPGKDRFEEFMFIKSLFDIQTKTINFPSQINTELKMVLNAPGMVWPSLKVVRGFLGCIATILPVDVTVSQKNVMDCASGNRALDSVVISAHEPQTLHARNVGISNTKKSNTKGMTILSRIRIDQNEPWYAQKLCKTPKRVETCIERVGVKMERSYNTTTYNYSIQKNSTSSKQMDQIKLAIASDPEKRMFAYCLEYLTQTL